jgi:hypothetical protein
MIRLVSDDAAQAVVDRGLFPVLDDLNVRFPPSRMERYQSIPGIDALSAFSDTDAIDTGP